VFVHKSLSRNDFETAFTAAETRRGILDNWSIIDDELKAAGRPYLARIKAQTATVEYLRDRSKRSRAAQILAKDVHEAAENVKDGLKGCEGMLAAADLVRTVLTVSEPGIHEPAKIEAAILIELYEALNG
jgi:hypothetical protein